MAAWRGKKPGEEPDVFPTGHSKGSELRDRFSSGRTASDSIDLPTRLDGRAVLAATAIAWATALATESCTVKTSLRLASYFSAQRCLSGAAAINWAVIRTRPRSRSTVPSKTASTFSSRAISGTVFLVPLYCATDVRESTRRALIFPRSAIKSSVMPSAKYSCSGIHLDIGECDQRFDEGTVECQSLLRSSPGARSGVPPRENAPVR